MALVGVMTIAFCANFFVDSPPSSTFAFVLLFFCISYSTNPRNPLLLLCKGVIFSGFVPRFKQYAAVQALGLIGSVIMPHNLCKCVRVGLAVQLV